MTSNTAQLNSFVGGMNLDQDVTVLESNQYRYAENVRVVTNTNGTGGVLQSMESIKKYTQQINENEDILGTTTVGEYGVIITKQNTEEGILNTIYRIRYTEVDGLEELTPVVKGYFNLTNNISIVGAKERDDLYKIYFTDGNSQMKVMNILDDSYGDTIQDNAELLDSTPRVKLDKLIFYNFGDGSLKSGRYRYCYQLFNVNGVESAISPLTSYINVTEYDTNDGSQKYEGSYADKDCGKSIVLKLTLYSNLFDRIRLYRLHYATNNQTPSIYVALEKDLNDTSGTSVITIEDNGSQANAQISVEEFNNVTSALFTSTSLATLYNILFAANVTDSTWDVDSSYDTRAYRCNKKGQIKLESVIGDPLEFDESQIDYMEVPDNHDCINPYNTIRYNDVTGDSDDKYAYIKVDGDYIFGGKGKNISYEFITADLRLTDEDREPGLAYPSTRNVSLNVSPSNEKSLTVHYQAIVSENNIEFRSKDVPFGDAFQSRIHNYTDPTISANYTGYLRDEVYRFGIVFYDKKNIPSPVHWIADIKMPNYLEIPPFDWIDYHLRGNALGIKFSIKNLPKEVQAYSIVRCERKSDDKTILSQCASSVIGKYKIQEGTESLPGEGTGYWEQSNEYRPNLILYSGKYTFSIEKLHDKDDGFNDVEGYMDEFASKYVKLVSPEISISGDSFNLIVSGGNFYLDFVRKLTTISLKDGDDNVYPCATPAFSKSTVNNWVYSNIPIASYPTSGGRYAKQLYLPTTYEFDDKITYLPNVLTEYVMTQTVFKCYKGNSDVDLNFRNKNYIKDSILSTLIPWNTHGGVVKFQLNINDIRFVNCAMSGFDRASWQAAWGFGGPSVICNLSEDLPLLDTYSGNEIDKFSNVFAVPMYNIRRDIVGYGGNTHDARENSIYESIGHYDFADNAEDICIFGGDTYLGIFDYPNTTVFLLNQGLGSWNALDRCKIYVGYYIPLETGVNLNLLSGDMYHKTVLENISKTVYGFNDAVHPAEKRNIVGQYADMYVQMDPVQMGDYHQQDEPYFVYNTAYSTEYVTTPFVPKSVYAKDYVEYPNRIYASQVKTAGEVNDNWAKFKVANYIDVDNQYGNITNLYNFKNQLFFFQDSAVGIASVNQQALIDVDNVGELSLGTGGVLTRFDYISTTNGNSIINDKSIVDTDHVFYWYDFNANELCVYNGNVASLSKTGSVLTYLNRYEKDRDNAVLSAFDKKYNEVWFAIKDKTLVFNETLNRFTSFYTFRPDFALSYITGSIFISKQGEPKYGFYEINCTDTRSSDINKDIKLQLVINDNVDYTKVFDNVRFQGEFYDKNRNELRNNLNGTVQFTTKHLDTGVKELNNIDYREDTYRFSIPRHKESNIEKDMALPARMRGKYLICNYEFKMDGESSLKIPSITTTYRYSLI